jgi:hypothetical protein
MFRVLVLLGSYLLLVFVLPVILSGVVSYRSLPAGRACPHCSGETLRLRSRWLDVSARLHPRTRIERRWCLGCGWEGAARQTAPAPLPGVEIRSGGARRSRPASVTQTLDVCLLSVDGADWRVMLQCWGNTGLYYGRLVFVGPSGRLWLDAVESFSGSDELEVLDQALSLPQPLLANRLRRLVTDA